MVDARVVMTVVDWVVQLVVWWVHERAYVLVVPMVDVLADW